MVAYEINTEFKSGSNLGSFVNILRFLRTQGTVFSGQILISLMNSFHCNKIKIQMLNVAGPMKAAELDPFLALTVPTVNFNNVFSLCL